MTYMPFKIYTCVGCSALDTLFPKNCKKKKIFFLIFLHFYKVPLKLKVSSQKSFPMQWDCDRTARVNCSLCPGQRRKRYTHPILRFTGKLCTPTIQLCILPDVLLSRAGRLGLMTLGTVHHRGGSGAIGTGLVPVGSES